MGLMSILFLEGLSIYDLIAIYCIGIPLLVWINYDFCHGAYKLAKESVTYYMVRRAIRQWPFWNKLVCAYACIIVPLFLASVILEGHTAQTLTGKRYILTIMNMCMFTYSDYMYQYTYMYQKRHRDVMYLLRSTFLLYIVVSLFVISVTKPIIIMEACLTSITHILLVPTASAFKDARKPNRLAVPIIGVVRRDDNTTRERLEANDWEEVEPSYGDFIWERDQEMVYYLSDLYESRTYHNW